MQLETDAQDIAGDIPRGDPEGPERVRVRHMIADAWAGIIIADADNADGITGIGRQALQIELPDGFRAGQDDGLDLQSVLDHPVHLAFDGPDLIGMRGVRNTIVTFGFLFFNVCAKAPLTS